MLAHSRQYHVADPPQPSEKGGTATVRRTRARRAWFLVQRTRFIETEKESRTSYASSWRRGLIHAGSGPRQVARHFPLEFGEVTRDHCHVERAKDGFLRLTIKQEFERGLEAALRRVPTRGEPFAGCFGHRDMVTGFTIAFADHDVEFQNIAVGCSFDIDHRRLHALFFTSTHEVRCPK